MTGKNSDWQTYVVGGLRGWRNHTASWLIASKTVPTILVRYEDIKRDMAKEVARVLEFLGLTPPMAQEKLKERLRGGFEAYHRQEHPAEIEYYTPRMEQGIRYTVKRTLQVLRKEGLDHTFLEAIEDYL